MISFIQIEFYFKNDLTYLIDLWDVFGKLDFYTLGELDERFLENWWAFGLKPMSFYFFKFYF